MNKLLWSPSEVEISQAWKFMQEVNHKYKLKNNINITTHVTKPFVSCWELVGDLLVVLAFVCVFGRLGVWGNPGEPWAAIS